ncbi:phage baseplate assembly protein [Candidatus Pacearchaeota archaeon]|nr:phage baseplate assembly protein [Candidatus Pacearchaeota archaeon]
MNTRTLTRAVAKLIAPLKRRVQLMIGRAILETINDTTKVQSVKASLFQDEVLDDVERFQEYGFTSVPFKNCEAIAVCVGGGRSHAVIIATDDRTRRPTGLAKGDAAMYNGHGVRVKVDHANDEVLLGDLPTAFVALANLVNARLSSIQTIVDTHTHITTATIGAGTTPGIISPTATPIGSLDSVAAEEVKAK